MKNVSSIRAELQSKSERWDWATQWSLCKADTLGIVVPGLFGYRLDTPKGGNYWGRVGQTVSDRTLEELRRSPIKIRENGLTPHGRKTKVRIRLQRYPDHTDFLSCHNSEVASWKRFAITILKNDHVCKYMGFSPTKAQITRQREIMEKYKRI